MTTLGYIFHDVTLCVEHAPASGLDLRAQDLGGDVVRSLGTDDSPCAHCVCDECGEYIYPNHADATPQF